MLAPLCAPPSQVPVNWLLQKANGMLPEGVGAPRPFTRDGPAALLTNGLLENGVAAIDRLWKQRRYI